MLPLSSDGCNNEREREPSSTLPGGDECVKMRASTHQTWDRVRSTRMSLSTYGWMALTEPTHAPTPTEWTGKNSVGSKNLASPAEGVLVAIMWPQCTRKNRNIIQTVTLINQSRETHTPHKHKVTKQLNETLKIEVRYWPLWFTLIPAPL